MNVYSAILVLHINHDLNMYFISPGLPVLSPADPSQCTHLPPLQSKEPVSKSKEAKAEAR